MAQESGFDMDAYKYALDESLASVMPDTWAGHGRMAIEDSGLEGDARTFAHRLLTRLSDKMPEKRASQLSKVAIKKARDNFE